MKTDLEVEVEVDLRQLGKVIIFRDKQTNRQLLLYIDASIHLFINDKWSLHLQGCKINLEALA